MGLLEDYIGEKLDAATRKRKGLPEKPSIWGALKDPQFRSDLQQGLFDAANRGAVASNLGAPVDLVTTLLRPLGYKVEKPIGGGEWFGDKMQQYGFVGDTRNPVAEALASIAIPVGASKVAPKVFAAEQAAIQNAGSSGGISSLPMAEQRGMVADPRKKEPFKGLLGGNPETVSVGTVNDWQKGLIVDTGGYQVPINNEVHATTDTAEHVIKRKRENFNGDDLWNVVDRSLRNDAKVNAPDPENLRMYPSLVKKGVTDPVTGKTYDATLPVAVEDGKIVIKTIIPDGLPARKKKTTWP